MRPFFSRLLRLLPIVPCVLATACSSSSSKDETPDSGHDASHKDATSTVDAGVDAETITNACDAGSYDAPIAVEAGYQTWSSLYRDYFGPGGVASCAGNGMCHGSTAQPGYYDSAFLCPTGDASTECWQGITSQAADGGAGIIVPDAGFANDMLSMYLCTDCGLNCEMPKGCTYSFTPYDMARIGAWVNAGAQNN